MAETDIAEVAFPDGSLMLVTAQRVGAGAQGPSDVGLKQALDFSAITSAVRGIVGELHSALETAKPNEVSIEFGFDFAVKGSQVVALLVDGGVSASVKMRLEWHGKSDKDG
jgi:Trypsin-co-occurring domain 1